jgi:long-chain acyl-CoA synthetase
MEKRFLELIERSIKAYWEQPALSDYNGAAFYYRDMAREMAGLHLLFEQAGIRKGDKIALIGRNSSRWVIDFFGILSFGAVAVPVLHDFNPESVHHIVNHSGARILFAARQHWEHLDAKAMPDVALFVCVDNGEFLHCRIPGLTPVHRSEPVSCTRGELRFHRETPDELAVLNYTSGTTGFSKGVMIPYRSLWSNTQYAADVLPFVHSGDTFVSMLPMAHMYGLAFEILNGINKGCHIHFLPRVPNPKSVMESLAKVRPVLIIAVPLIIEKIVRNHVFPLLRRPVIRTLYRVPGLKQLIGKIIRRRLNAAFGGRFVEIVIGGAAINKEIEAFLKSIRFHYTVGYGMTECGPLVAYEQWDTYRQGSVGRIVDRMEMKIDSPDPQREAGEILVRGMNNMLGYYKNPEATAGMFLPDGWMRTGDLGTIDRDGFLYIRGRSKALILSSNGQNIYPEEIESLLNGLPYVAESLVATRKDKLVALIFPDREQAGKNNLSPADLQAVMHDNLNRLNRQLPVYSKVAAVELRDAPFEKTPKQSIKRYLYQSESDQMK